MPKLDRIIQRLKAGTGSITFQELEYILSQYGYRKIPMGKTSCLRVAWYHETNLDVIRLHKPHPGNELKQALARELEKK